MVENGSIIRMNQMFLMRFKKKFIKKFAKILIEKNLQSLKIFRKFSEIFENFQLESFEKFQFLKIDFLKMFPKKNQTLKNFFDQKFCEFFDGLF